MGTAINRKFAVVTGASSGIGLELARQCLQNGFDILVCADSEKIEEAATQLSTDGNVVEVCRADLATYEGCEELVRAVGGRAIDALLLNAGVGTSGEFVDIPLEDELRMIALNCDAVIHLAKRLIPAMKARGSGRVLVTASVVSTAAAPYQAVYAATKAFDLNFAEGLRYELKDSGVTVTALQPGATDTDFFERAGMEDTKVGQGKKDDPAEVAKMGFEAMMAGKDKVIAASMKSKLEGLAHEVLGEEAKAKMIAKQTKPGSSEKH
jgi:short-subunit dehydrogenase